MSLRRVGNSKWVERQQSRITVPAECYQIASRVDRSVHLLIKRARDICKVPAKSHIVIIIEMYVYDRVKITMFSL